LVDFVDLGGYFIGGGFVFGNDEGKFPFVVFEVAGEGLREDFERCVVWCEALKIKNGFDARDVLKCVCHGTNVGGREAGVTKNHVNVGKAEIFA